MSEVFTVQQKIDEQRAKVEINSRYVDQICLDTLSKYTRDLDNLIEAAKEIIMKSDDTITTEEFESIAVKIPIFLYSLVTVQEQMGIRADISKAFEKEKFSNVAMSVQGTVKEKEFLATTESKAESVVTIASAHTYKMLQSKIQIALELLASVKRVLSLRLENSRLPE